MRDPYSDTQIINNAVRLLMQANIFPLKEFDDWEAITPKTYPALKIFISRAYMRRILAQQLCNTLGQMGYMTMNQNMHASLDGNNNDDTMATDNMITNVAALRTGGSITAANTIYELVINAINQLNANQAVLVQQIAAMLLINHNRTLPPAQITVPVLPMQQHTLPMQVLYAGAATQNTFNVGQGG